MLLLSVQVQRYLVQTEMLEIERVARQVSVECPIAHSPMTMRVGSCPENSFS